MSMGEFFSNADKKRDSYQAQTSGGSVDYDYDKVQVQDGGKSDADGQDDNSNRKRSVKIDLTQKSGALPDGTSIS